MRKPLLVLLLGGALFTSSGNCSAQANTRAAELRSQQPATLVAVHASGSTRYAEADIAAASGLKVGAKLSPQDFKAGADKLAASGAFDEVRYKFEPAGTGYSVTYEVTDAPEFLPVTFDNFVWFSDTELADTVRNAVPLFRGEVPVNGDMVQQVTEALQSLLAEHGIAGNVRLMQESSYGTAASDGKVIGGVLMIDGVSIHVRRVDFPGTPEGDKSMLEQAAKMLLQTPYQRSIVHGFADANIRPLYLKLGFLRVSSGDARVELLNKDTHDPEIAVHIPVSLGAQYRIAEVTWEGAKAFYPEDLGKAMMLKAGAVADAMQLDEDLRKVLTLYGSKGFVRASANATPVFDDQQRAVSYIIHVREGAVYRFRSVELQGIDKASAARLREEWKLREGEPFDASYPREYARAIGRLLPRNVSIEPRLEIDDESKAVDYTMRFIQHADKVIREKK